MQRPLAMLLFAAQMSEAVLLLVALDKSVLQVDVHNGSEAGPVPSAPSPDPATSPPSLFPPTSSPFYSSPRSLTVEA